MRSRAASRAYVATYVGSIMNDSIRNTRFDFACRIRENRNPAVRGAIDDVCPYFLQPRSNILREWLEEEEGEGEEEEEEDERQ